MRITSILSLSLLYSRFFFVQSNNSFTEIRIIMFVVREYQIVRFNQWETRVGNNWPIAGLETHPNWCVLPTQISPCNALYFQSQGINESEIFRKYHFQIEYSSTVYWMAMQCLFIDYDCDITWMKCR